MTGDPEHEDGSSVVTLESFPDGSLSQGQLRVLEEVEEVDIAAPIVVETGSGRVTHFNLVVGDTFYYVGWNPDKGQWERFLVVAEGEDSAAVESSITVVDDESGEPELCFDVESDPTNEEIAEFVWEYVEHTYSDTSGLHNVIGEAVEEFDEE